jgi:hypothetical protein
MIAIDDCKIRGGGMCFNEYQSLEPQGCLQSNVVDNSTINAPFPSSGLTLLPWSVFVHTVSFLLEVNFSLSFKNKTAQMPFPPWNIPNLSSALNRAQSLPILTSQRVPWHFCIHNTFHLSLATWVNASLCFHLILFAAAGTCKRNSGQKMSTLCPRMGLLVLCWGFYKVAK